MGSTALDQKSKVVWLRRGSVGDTKSFENIVSERSSQERSPEGKMSKMGQVFQLVCPWMSPENWG